MRCKTCHYSLAGRGGLAEHRCPEFGTPFDPGDRRTFLKLEYVPLSRKTLTVVCLTIYAAFALFVVYRVRSSHALLLIGGASVVIFMFGLLHLVHWADWKAKRMKF